MKTKIKLWVYVVGLCYHFQFVTSLVHSASNAQYDSNTLLSPGSLYPFGGEMPTPRVHATLTLTGNFIISYGGYDTDGRPLDDINLFDFRYQKWSGPILRKECCNTRGDELEKLGSIHHTFDPFQKVGFEGDLPLPRGEHSAVSVGGNLFVFGGNNSEYGLRQDFYRFDPVSLVWKVMDSSSGRVPPKRAGHSMVTSDSSIFLFGGRGRYNTKLGSSLFGFNDVWRYDVETNYWELLTRTTLRKASEVTSDGATIMNNVGPIGRQYGSIAMFRNKLVLFGGIDPVSHTAFNDVWVFHTGFRYWECLLDHSGSGIGFSPPPLYKANLIPIPQDTGTGPVVVDDAEEDESVFLLYGGLGGGGSCGDSHCLQKESTLGQVYQLKINWRNFTATRIRTVDERQTRIGMETSYTSSSAEKVTWNYARLTDSVSERGRRGKSFALETVVFDSARSILYELGGLQENSTQFAISHSQAVSPSILRETGGFMDPLLWDLSTGEHLRHSLTIPVNAPWNYQSALATAQPLAHAASIQFLRSFRYYTVTPTDIILIKEDRFPDSCN